MMHKERSSGRRTVARVRSGTGFVAVLATVLALPVVLGESVPCQYTSPSGHAYDLSPLRTKHAFVFQGGTRHARGFDEVQRLYRGRHIGFHQGNYDYYVNFCGLAERPSACKDKEDAPAYQVHSESNYWHREQECFALGSLRGMYMRPIDYNKPEVGVQIVYPEGQECHRRSVSTNSTGHKVVEWIGTQRELIINLTCDATQGDELSDLVNAWRYSIAGETEMCTYVVNWKTRYGCPRAPRTGVLFYIEVFALVGAVVGLYGLLYGAGLGDAQSATLREMAKKGNVLAAGKLMQRGLLATPVFRGILGKRRSPSPLM